VVELVLEHARLGHLRLDHDGLAVLVERAHPHAGRALDVDPDAGDREAALLGHLGLLARPLEHRVDERADRRVGVGAVDEHAVEDAHLGGGEAGLHRVLEQPPHLGDLVPHDGVDGPDGPRRLTQDGVAVLAHARQRGLAAGELLGSRLTGRGHRGESISLTPVPGTADALVELPASTNAMADRVPHPSSTVAATFGPYSYGFSYRTWRFS
jgi:hypothetical protein